MFFSRRTKGVISVFLIIIMLPLFTSAVLLVDGTRYQSAKTMIQEAGDLAAYSTIAKYNMDLKDQFGLFAIDDDDVSASFNKYFKETLGYSSSESESYSDKVQKMMSSAMFGGGKYGSASFINMYNFEADDASVTMLYPLSNPAVLQNQIVEYSKYRGVETVLERLEILNKFDKVNEETRAAQEKMAAVEHLSSIEENFVGDAANRVAEIEDSVTSYNNALISLFDAAKQFQSASEYELSALAIKDPSLNAKKQEREKAYEDLKAAISTMRTSANELSGKIDDAYISASRARDKLEEYQDLHPDESDEVYKTAQADINILNQILAQDNSVYSIWNLKQCIKPDQVNDLETRLMGNMDPFINALNATYRNYQTELNNAEDPSSVRYHFMLKSGAEWGGTQIDHTDDNSTIETIRAQAGMVLEEYVGKIVENEKGDKRIGTVNVASYKMPEFKNLFYDTVRDYEETEEFNKREASKKATDAKKDESEDDGSYKTIPDEEAELLPSKDCGEQDEIDIPDVKEDSASSTLSESNDLVSRILGHFLESSRNDILVYCYLLDNFKTRVTEKNINSETDHAGIKDKNLADWRYRSADGELDMRYRPKKDLTTFFKTNEVEYVFGGCQSEFKNATIVYGWIYGTRFVNNFLAVYSAYSATDSWMKVEIDGLAAAASAASFGTIPATVFKWVFITAWAAGETALDLALMIDDGYKIPLIKTKDNIFFDSILEIGNAFDANGRKSFVKEAANDNGLADKVNVCYEDYLIILLAFVDRETRLKRIGDLIQLNMRQRCDSSFLMSSAYTYIKADTSVSMRFMFRPVRQFTEKYPGTGLRVSNTIYQGY